MRVGFFAPLPPARTGVADYAVSLLRALQRRGDVRAGATRADIFLYHLGNNQLHRAIYERALRRPGVVVLHDAVLQHFFLGRLGQDAYADEFVYNYGEWSRDLGRELYRGRSGSGFDNRYFEYPMLRRIAETARAVVVHNPAAARIVRRHAPAARVIEIPHLFDPPELPGEGEVVRFRARLEIPACAFVFGVFGYLRESKRLAAILRALASVPDAYLLIAGSFVSADLERAVGPLLAEARVRRLGYLREREFWLASRAVDACINLRYPAAGETSGIAIRLMGIGKPVLVSAGEENARFPETACVRIEPGVAEGAGLRDHMILLSSFPRIADEIGRRAAGHIAARHPVGQVAELYWKALCE